MQYESARRETGHGISSSERTISLWRGRQRNKHQEVIALYLIEPKICEISVFKLIFKNDPFVCETI